MIQIHFIVNPIAGKGKSLISEKFLAPYFIHSLHQLTVKYSDYKKHAIALARESIQQGADTIIACGGDGTINEVASSLVGTTIPLGIIPIGSGNGLASNLGIPKNVRKAIEIIKLQQTMSIDVGRVNEQNFFSNMGIGFDAKVIKLYESSQKRTIYGYIRACLTSFRKSTKDDELSVQINELNTFVNPFIILISNSNEMGYNLSLTPKASLQDGLLDVLIVARLNRIKMLWLGVLILINKVYWLKEAKNFQTKELQMVRNDKDYFEPQIDGELHKIETKALQISVTEKALRILVAG